MKNTLSVTRGEVGEVNGGGEEGGRVFRNNYKGHMDKSKGGCIQGREVGMAGDGGVVGVNADNCA